MLLAANVPGFSGRVKPGPRVSAALDGAKATVVNEVRVGGLGAYRRGAGRPFKNFLTVWGWDACQRRSRPRRPASRRQGGGERDRSPGRYAGRPALLVRASRLVEAYAGRARMEWEARRLSARDLTTVLFGIMTKRGRDRLTSGVYFTAQKPGTADRMARALIADAAWALGLALASEQNLLDLEAISVGGGRGDRLGRPFVNRIVAHMRPHLFVPEKPPMVLTTELGDLCGAVGAAVLAGERLTGGASLASEDRLTGHGAALSGRSN